MTVDYRRAVAVAAMCLICAAACTRAPSQIGGEAEVSESQVAPDFPHISFIVSFRPYHALGRAQSLQYNGRYDEAEQLVAIVLSEDVTLRGLCFDRFTVGGAEIVLNVCAQSSWEEHLVTQRRWFEYLGATPGVAYVERNLVVDATEAPS